MVDLESVEAQLRRIHFNYKAWGRAEVQELPNILLEKEEIHECVNGIYEGGFALLVATNFRLLLIDKKPLNYLTIEDMRFDMINETDYSHRLFGARITVSAGNKTLQFRSYNQPRLRKLIGHVQHGMADAKTKQSSHQENQNEHLERINQQLQAYLLAQHAQQEEIRKKLEAQLADVDEKQKKLDAERLEIPAPPKPSPELNDYLLAQRLLEQVKNKNPEEILAQSEKKESAEVVAALEPTRTAEPAAQIAAVSQASDSKPYDVLNDTKESEMFDLYSAGMQEIFGRKPEQLQQTEVTAAATPEERHTLHGLPHVLEINPLKIAYSKLPLAMRQRRFGRPMSHSALLPLGGWKPRSQSSTQ